MQSLGQALASFPVLSHTGGIGAPWTGNELTLQG